MLKAVALFAVLVAATLFCAHVSTSDSPYAGICKVLMYVFAVLSVIPARYGFHRMRGARGKE